MSPLRILIVEDQREVSRLLRSALETLDIALEVVETPSGEEALLDSSHNPVDLLVADYRLPGMSGIELMHKVQKNHPQVKTILVTGQTDPMIRKEVAEAGANAFFIKPIPMADFLDSVERHLGLVKTGLPPEPIAEVDEIEIQRGLPDVLAGLRQEMGAASVLLLNESGRILARAGELPEKENEAALISPLLSIYSAGQKVARTLGQKMASYWCVFDSGIYDLVFTPVGLTHAMLVLGKGIAGEEQFLKTVLTFSAARKIIERVLDGTTKDIPTVPEPPPPPPEVIEQNQEEMEPLFKDSQQKLTPVDVNEFWDKAADTHKPPSNPDMLSYEQAKKLGLAPEEKS